MTPGTYNFPAISRGDTFRARDVATLTQDGTPVALAAARLHVRHWHTGALIYEFSTAGASPNASITGAGSNTVTLAAVTPADTADWPPGEHDYDLEVTFQDGTVGTILAGKLPVRADVTRTTA